MSCNSRILQFICERYRDCGSPGTGVRILRNPLEPGLSSDFTSYPRKPAGTPKQYRLLKHCIQGANLLQLLKQRCHVELQNSEKVYKTGFGISLKQPQDCLFLLSKRLHLSLFNPHVSVLSSPPVF